MTIGKKLSTALLALFVAVFISSWSVLDSQPTAAATAAWQPEAAPPVACTDLPDYRTDESAEQWLRREDCRQQQHVAEQTAAWAQEPMGGVVWEPTAGAKP